MTRMTVHFVLTLTLVVASASWAASPPRDFSPQPQEQQLPRAMHSEMAELAHITVGTSNADMTGDDNRVLQAAVDYVAGLGGGVVEIGAGEYMMHDSLHLRSNVTVRGVKGKTILRKAGRVRLGPGPRRRLRRGANHRAGPQRIRRRLRRRRLGQGRRRLPHDRRPHHGPQRQHVLHRQAADGRLHGGTTTPRRRRCSRSSAGTTPKACASRIWSSTATSRRMSLSTAAAARASSCTEGSGRSSAAASCGTTTATASASSSPTTSPSLDCISEDNAVLGLHPGSGSQRPTVRNCIARRNGTDGLFLCWRVRHGLFEHNTPGGERPVRHLHRPQGLRQPPPPQHRPAEQAARRVLPQRIARHGPPPQPARGEHHREQRRRRRSASAARSTTWSS